MAKPNDRPALDQMGSRTDPATEDEEERTGRDLDGDDERGESPRHQRQVLARNFSRRSSRR